MSYILQFLFINLLQSALFHIVKKLIVMFGKHAVPYFQEYVFTYEFEITTDVPKLLPYLKVLFLAFLATNIDSYAFATVVIDYILIVG